jgi:hypothetical protein
MPEFGRALEEFTNLWRAGLIYFKNFGRPNMRNLADFPTGLFYFYDFFDPRLSNDYTGEFASFDASGYRIYALYGGQTPVCEYERGDYYSYSGSDAVAGPDTDAGEFLRFSEWLGIRENYISLFYGEEGTDYALKDGRIVPLESNAAGMAAIRQNLYFLERSEFNAVPVNAPLNYEDETERLVPLYTLITTREDYMLADEFYGAEGEDGTTLLSAAAEDYNQLMNDLFWGFEIEIEGAGPYRDTAPEKTEVEQLVESFFEKQKRHEDFFDGFAGIFGQIYKAAAERYKR